MGQKLSQEQKDIIDFYLKQEPEVNHPLWCQAYRWYFHQETSEHYAQCPWDFGLISDSTVLRNRTEFYSDLWGKLYDRQKDIA